MADIVQYKLERMVDELEDLEQRGIFTRQEIAEIVKQRRKFEYRLKRPSPLKEDFVAYIEYETQLDALRSLRKKSVTRELKKQGNKNLRKSKSDLAGLIRIIDIYELALKRYKGDIDLWFRYLEFCKLRKNGRMKKALAKLVRLHPKVAGVWIYAAAWEFDQNSNVVAARALMQEGLRFCPTSEDLWVEYLRMELTYLNKLKARKVALGEDKGTLTRDPRTDDEKQWKDENKELFMTLDEKEDNSGEDVVPEDNNGENVEPDESQMNQELFADHGMNIFRTVYGGAIEAVPSSLNLRKRFFEILEGTNLSHYEDMCKEVLYDMKRDFSTEPEFWDWLARQECNLEAVLENGQEIKIPHVEKAIQVYEEALMSVPSGTMFSLYASFLSDIVAPKDEEIDLTGLSGDAENFLPHLLSVYERAESMGIITEYLACKQILTKVPVSKSENLWQKAFKFYASKRRYFDKLVEISFLPLARDGGSESGFSLSSTIVGFILQKDGIHKARDTYKRFLALPHPGLALYRKCIELETDLASKGDKDSLANARKLYESALATYDQNVGLWQDYYRMEAKMGTSQKATAVYWSAMKTLKDASEFTASLDLGDEV
ncbi:hypothetical protein KIW84_040164 [Lathyrus oleraceus]|uniref:U3 small nucleolar RNA-associated protein 6 homolog n=1 Tax=Pisum sativum TaxID=3888 RepID=A0A9D4X9F4_PEA|nr:hypothetical protein KIW84_040164 [Pisum sativum]